MLDDIVSYCDILKYHNIFTKLIQSLVNLKEQDNSTSLIYAFITYDQADISKIATNVLEELPSGVSPSESL